MKFNVNQPYVFLYTAWRKYFTEHVLYYLTFKQRCIYTVPPLSLNHGKVFSWDNFELLLCEGSLQHFTLAKMLRLEVVTLNHSSQLQLVR